MQVKIQYKQTLRAVSHSKCQVRKDDAKRAVGPNMRRWVWELFFKGRTDPLAQIVNENYQP